MAKAREFGVECAAQVRDWSEVGAADVGVGQFGDQADARFFQDQREALHLPPVEFAKTRDPEGGEHRVG